MNRLTALTLLILLLFSTPVFGQGIIIRKQEIYQAPRGESPIFTYSPHAKVIMKVNGEEYLPISGYYDYNTNHHYGTGLLKRIDNRWKLIHLDETQMLGARSHSFVDSSTILLSEAYEDFPDYHDWGGYIYELHIESDELKIKKNHPLYAYYHYVASGDLNNDGRYDMMSSQWLFLQKEDNSFELQIPFYLKNKWGEEAEQYADSTFDFIDWGIMKRINRTTLATGIFDLYAGGRPEIIQGQIDVVSDPSIEVDPLSGDARGQVYILEYNDSNNRYEVVYELPRVQPREYLSAPETFNVLDANLDGINDLIIETSNCYACSNANASNSGPMPQGIEVWLGKADKTFYLNQTFLSEGPVLGVFLLDVNSDSYPDIVFEGASSSSGFVRNWCTGETTPNCDELRQQGLATRDGVFLHKAIYINDGSGLFNPPRVQMEIPSVFPDSWFMPHVRDGNLIYYGFEKQVDPDGLLTESLLEIEVSSDFYDSSAHAPTVVVTTSRKSCIAPCTITFDASGSLDPDGEALTFDWDFGDGTTSSVPVEDHVFRMPGDHVVRVTASDGVLTGSFEIPVSIASGVDTESFELPETFVLKAAYPNPFNPTTTVTYGLPAAAEVRITATDLLGRRVATLVAGDMKAAGYHTVQFNAEGLASGTYLIRMEASDFVATQQVVLLK